MSIYSEVFEAFLTKATFPANSAAAARADQDLQRLLSESPGDVEEVSRQAKEVYLKMASAVLDLVQSVPPGVASVLKVVPFVGSAVNFTMLSTVLGPRALSELREPPYRIADDTAKALIDAGVGLIPGGGLPVAMFKLASAWLEAANADFPGEWSEWAVNGVVAAAPEVSVGVLSFFNDPTGIYGTQERNRAYQNLVEALNVSGLVQAAISGDRAAQGLIEAGLTDSILIEPMTRPPEYWHQRAQLLLVKLKGDLTGTFDGTPLQGPAGFYEGWVGKEYVEGLVGVVDYTSGTTYQFGTQGNWAGSALGNDLYWGTASNDFFAGMTGDDVIYGFEGYDTLKGELGRDTIYAGANADWAWGGDHDDLIYGEAGDDRLFGEADNDTLDGGADNDEMWGGEGSDVLSGGTGQDTLYGEAGADTLIGDDDSERDLLSGGADFDTYFAGANDVIIDSDQYGQVSFQGSRVTGGILDTRVSPNGRDSEGNVHYISLDGATSLVYNAAAATLLVTKNGKSFTVNDFRPTNAYDIDGTSLNPGQKSTFATALNIKLVDVPNGNIANDLASTVLAAAGATPIRRWDPLVLDLNADGILGTQDNTPGVHFDLDASGFAERTSWVSAQDGLLVRDLNGDGSIDTGRELFGDQTVLPNGAFATHGFTALAALDSNMDGKVDASDAAWGELRVWRDADSNGMSEASELLSMADAGISAVNLSSTAPNTLDASGNTLARLGSFTRTDGTTAKAGSFLFNRDVTDSFAKDVLEVSSEIEALPDLQGFGAMHTLHQAMTRDASLATMVQATVASTDYRTLRTQFETVLQRWAGADTVVPGSRGTSIDAKHLAVVEKFYGQAFEGTEGPNPNTGAGPQLTAAYKTLLDQLYLQFLPQAQLKPVWSQVTFSAEGGEPDFTAAGPAMRALLGEVPCAAVQLLYEFAKSVKQFGFEASAGFSAFKEGFTASEFSYDRVIQGALDGVPLVLGDEGADSLSSSAKAIFFSLGGADVVTGSGANDVIQSGGGNDVLNGSEGDDVLNGGAGNDVLDGGRGLDHLIGGPGDDILGGGTGTLDQGISAWMNYQDPGAGNVYEGGNGDDTLNGSWRSDEYRFNVGDGSDILIEPEIAGQPTGQIDVLKFGAGISATDVTVSRVGTNLVLALANGTDKVTIKDWYSTASATARQVERVEFPDGTVWLAADLTARGLVLTGTDGADVLYGLPGFNNIIYGGASNDQLTGANLGDQLFGQDGADSLFGTDGADSMYGGAGDDVLDGGKGQDYLSGGAGNDVLGGAVGTVDQGINAWMNYQDPGAGNIYDGGKGDDTLNGSWRSDEYRFNVGDGSDIIIEPEISGQPNGQVDVLKFGAGISATDVAVNRVGTNLVLALVNGTDKVTIKDWYSTASATARQVERVEFADGTVWLASDLTARGLVLMGTEGADVLVGLSGYNNTIYGGGGDDQLTGANLGDQIYGQDGADKLYGTDGADLMYGGAGDDILDGGKGQDYLSGGDGNDILGGAVGTVDQGINAWMNFQDPGAGNIYEGGKGNDTLNGSWRSDEYRFNAGDGSDTIIEPEIAGQPTGQTDVLKFGATISAADVRVSRTGMNLVLTLTNAADQITVKDWFSAPTSTAKQLEKVIFQDGTEWLASELTARALTVTDDDAGHVIQGLSNFSNSLYGAGGADTLYGGSLADTLVGGAGNDGLYGGAGDDTYRWSAGDGYDTLNESSGSDTLVFEGVNRDLAVFYRVGNDLEVNVGAGQGVLVKNQFADANAPAVDLMLFGGASLTASQLAGLAGPRP